MILKWVKLLLSCWKAQLITLQYREILSNGPDYEVSSSFTLNLLTMPLKPDKP